MSGPPSHRDEGLKSLEEAAACGEPLATLAGSRAFARYVAHAVSAREFAVFQQDLAAASTLTWLEDSSHFAHVDSPERFVATVRPFLTDSPTPEDS